MSGGTDGALTPPPVISTSGKRRRASLEAAVQANAQPAEPSPLFERVKRLKVLSEEYRNQLAAAEVVKNPDELLKLVLDALSADTADTATLVKFHRIQRCTIRQVIRQVLRKLTPAQAKKLVISFLDPSLLSGVCLTNVEPQFRQVWVREAVLLYPKELLAPQVQSIFSSMDMESTLAAHDSMARLYGRLTTVLDHQYRQNPLNREK